MQAKTHSFTLDEEQLIRSAVISGADARRPMAQIARIVGTLLDREASEVLDQIEQIRSSLADSYEEASGVASQTTICEGAVIEVEAVDYRVGELGYPYGVMCRLPDGRLRLLHVSQVADAFVRDVREYVTLGDKFLVKIVRGPGGKPSISARAVDGVGLSAVERVQF